MRNIIYEMDDLIMQYTDGFRDIEPGMTEEVAKWLIKRAYEDGYAPFSAQDFATRWNELYEMDSAEKRSARKELEEYEERIKVIRAMETLARCVNDESVFMQWLEMGVADGDITDETTDDELDYYADDKSFQELLDTFLDLMRDARRSGGLFAGGIVSNRG